MRRSPVVLAIASAILLATIPMDVGNAAPLTGCLSNKGKLTKLALGDTPSSPCRGGETEVSIGSDPEPKMVLRDDDQEEVGVVMDVSEGAVLTLLTFVDSAGNDRDILLLAGRSGFREQNPQPFFVADDCMGQPWLSNVLPNDPDGERFLNGSAEATMAESGEMILFAMTSDVLSVEPIELGSFLAGGTCHDANFLKNSVCIRLRCW